jgi:ribonuclease P protein component
LAVKKSFRVKKTTDFDAIFKAKKSFANRAFIVYQLDNQKTHYRVGISVSKKLGNAVRRNRVKRLIRQVVRQHESHLADPKDFVVIARQGVEGFDYAEVEKNLLHVLRLSKIYRS